MLTLLSEETTSYPTPELFSLPNRHSAGGIPAFDIPCFILDVSFGHDRLPKYTEESVSLVFVLLVCIYCVLDFIHIVCVTLETPKY